MLSNLFGLGWVWRHGWLVAYLSSAVVSPLSMGYLILFVEERFLHFREQYFSFIVGNSAGLSTIVGATSLMAGTLPPGAHWWTSREWMIICFVVAAVLGPAQAVLEYRNKAFTPGQFRSPAKAYHNTLVYAVLAFWIFSGTIPAIGCSAAGFGGSTFGWHIQQWHIHAPGWQFYVVMAAFGLFAAMVVYDSTRGAVKPHAHVEFSWRRFRRGDRQVYEETQNWRRLRFFPPRLALPLLAVVITIGYLRFKM